MKKIVYLIIVLLTVFSFNMEVEAAKFEVDLVGLGNKKGTFYGFNLKYDDNGSLNEDSKKLLEAVCAGDFWCTAVYENGNTIYGDFNNILLYMGNSNVGIVGFFYGNRSKNGPAVSIDSFYEQFNNDTSLLISRDVRMKIIKEQYCNNYTSNEDICVELAKLEGSSIGEANADGDMICPIKIMTTGAKSSEFTANIYYDKDQQYISVSSAEADVSFTSGNDYFGYTFSAINKFYLYSLDVDHKTFTSQYIKKLEDSKKCPDITFCLKDISPSKGKDYEWYAQFDSVCDKKKYSGFGQTVNGNGSSDGIIDQSNDEYIKGDDITYSSCEELLSADGGEELVNLLKTAITIFKILVPLILVVLTTLDFAKTVFGGEDDMKKAQKKAIKRVIVAAFIFLIPALLNIILKVASLIWPVIDPGLCGILK